ncbi:MAG: helix-turn-helix domain-containing protein [bacterium]|nr:helix-turn-helix domain-containing protein [bacterium]
MLQPLGIDQKTERVYRALLSIADATAFRIAKEAGLKRTSVYYLLEELIVMGLVSTYTHRGVTRYVAENPAKLKSLFEQKMILAERILPELQKEIGTSGRKTAIRIFEGKEAIQRMSEEALEAKDKKILSLGSSRKLIEFLGGKHGFGARRRKRGIFTRSLRFEDDEKSTGARLHDTRILPKDFNFPVFMMIFDKKVSLVLFESDGIGLLIASENFANAMRSLFEVLWAFSRIPARY